MAAILTPDADLTKAQTPLSRSDLFHVQMWANSGQMRLLYRTERVF